MPITRRYPFERLPRLPSQAIPVWRFLRSYLGEGGTEAARQWARDCFAAGSFSVDLASVSIDVDDSLEDVLADAERFDVVAEGTPVLCLALAPGLVADMARRVARVPGARGGASCTAGERGIVVYSLAWLLAALPLGSTWRLREGSSRFDRDRRPLVFSFRFMLGDFAGSAWLLVDPEVPLVLGTRQMGRRQPRSWFRTLPFEFSVGLKRVTLPLAEVGLLAPGDVIAGASLPGKLEGSVVWVSMGSGGFAGRLEDDTIVVEAWRRDPPPELGEVPRRRDERAPGGDGEMKGDAMRDEIMKGDATDTERGRLIDGLEVDISVEVARITLTAGELNALDTGDVIRLGRPLVAPLDLRIGSRIIGRAELVDIDGEAGLRLVEVYD
ncbi:MAG: FliM/FliN family flagellar motor switch protein [Deltaproteobacteria bacterium]|nr:FliM/FliN family flagellar motor switch protein [Deltaproteobacteria bacterium]